MICKQNFKQFKRILNYFSYLLEKEGLYYLLRFFAKNPLQISINVPKIRTDLTIIIRFSEDEIYLS